MENLILNCVLAVAIPQGQICVKPDGNIEMPAGIELTEASKRFWSELAKAYYVIKNEKCI